MNTNSLGAEKQEIEAGLMAARSSLDRAADRLESAHMKRRRAEELLEEAGREEAEAKELKRAAIALIERATDNVEAQMKAARAGGGA